VKTITLSTTTSTTASSWAKSRATLIAYSALEKDGLNVPTVPVGLNYFRSHRWRGRAVVEYGEPIYTHPSTLNAYKAGGPEKQAVCNELLDQIQDSMRSVIVSTPDYESLQIIHTARRLYQCRGWQGETGHGETICGRIKCWVWWSKAILRKRKCFVPAV
jgi:glycerol-3-phosphate O-acyltransferase/dihydroxyacetone phosphate acyltransferase